MNSLSTLESVKDSLVHILEELYDELPTGLKHKEGTHRWDASPFLRTTEGFNDFQDLLAILTADPQFAIKDGQKVTWWAVQHQVGATLFVTIHPHERSTRSLSQGRNV